MDAHPDPQWILIVKIVVFVSMLVLGALLSAVAQAMTIVNHNTIRKLAEDGNKKAQSIVKVFEDSIDFLLMSQVVNAFFGFLISAILAVDLTKWLYVHLYHGIGNYRYPLAMVLITIVLSGVFIVFSKTLPRQIALQHPEGVALSLVGYGRFCNIICKPIVKIVKGITNFFLLVTRQQKGFTTDRFSEDDVISMLEVGQETGVIKEEGKKMINSIFDFDDKLAYEVMTPRTDVFAIDINAPTEEYIEEMMEMRYSRIPVYEDDSDNIIGILIMKDYMKKAWEYGFEHVHIHRILREPFLVPETKNIDSLFFELQVKKQHIAVLIDEYGGFSGIVTMEDIIEQIVGDIDDEYDEETPQIVPIDDHTYYIDGAMDLDDINEELGTELESDNNETVGGLLIDILGEIPSEEKVENSPAITHENYVFRIESVKDRRIERIKMEILPKVTEEDEDGEKDKKEKSEEASSDGSDE